MTLSYWGAPRNRGALEALKGVNPIHEVAADDVLLRNDYSGESWEGSSVRPF